MTDYVKRREEMKKLRLEDGLTNTDIGKMYGISRERVRQIIGNTGRFFRREWTERKMKSGEVRIDHHSQIAQAPGVKRVWIESWGKKRHDIVGNGQNAIGARFEEMASVILASNGMGNTLMPYRHPYDIHCQNGARIEVKSGQYDVSNAPSQTRHVYPHYAIPYRNSIFDFMFVFVPDPKEESGYTYYVIPVQALLHLKEETRIRIPHPPMSQKPSKWHQYHRKIDLILNFQSRVR